MYLNESLLGICALSLAKRELSVDLVTLSVLCWMGRETLSWGKLFPGPAENKTSQKAG